MRGSTQIKQTKKYNSGITGDFSDAPGKLARLR
ncbi:hypothetical protein NGUA41_02682 [Salmonella enterica]|nr:hypothetical protein NGUA40_01072 [Salmonella enterica]GAS77814.1 hypothetical protein NGUA41_02682 [Salmonella enterica]